MNTNLNLSTLDQTTSNSNATSVRRPLAGLFTAALMMLGFLLCCTPASAQQEEEQDAFDILMQAWEERNRSEDIISQKRSDAMRDEERLYDPSTGEVYQFDNGFYDSYDINRSEYEMNNLEQLPDDNYDLWMATPRDGEEEVE